MSGKTSEWWSYGILSEVAFYVLLYYGEMLLKVDGNLWWSALVLWVLANIAILSCPMLRKCSK